MQTRYIFGCNHENRNITFKTTFERGLEIPTVFCDDCFTLCNICLKKTEKQEYENLELCLECFCNVRKIIEI